MHACSRLAAHRAKLGVRAADIPWATSLASSLPQPRPLGTVPCHALVEQRRGITRLYTSFYPGNLYPNQLVRHPQRRPARSANSLRTLQPRHGVHDAGNGVTADEAARSATHTVSWRSAEDTDLMHVNTLRDVPSPSTTPQRPYVPLSEVAKLELQGDYLTEGGMHQEALEYYGVVAKAYARAYPDGHEQRVGILSKLSGAFRRTGRLASSKAIAEDALAALDGSPAASLELMVELLLELGLTKEALGQADAGEVYEDAVDVVQSFHDFGESHRMLRLLPRLSRRLRLNYEEKFRYFSPFDMDRTFALVDQCLERASELYKRTGETEKRIRVLQTRKQLIDKKFFNLRDFAGRIHTMRGHWMRRAGVLTNAPTPDELLRYSPTIHQVYRDFKYELNTPIGRESEVHEGVNRTVLDMGNPYRRRGKAERQRMREADYNFAKYTRSKEFST